jgi:hypothetical protein
MPPTLRGGWALRMSRSSIAGRSGICPPLRSSMNTRSRRVCAFCGV